MHGEPEWWEEVYDYDGLVRRMMTGEAMLYNGGYYHMYQQRAYNFYFGGQAVPVGYPVEDGSVGSYFEPLGIKLAMSSACQDKEAAWEYIRQTLLLKVDLNNPNIDIFSIYEGIAINKRPYNADRRHAVHDKDTGVVLDGNIYPTDMLSSEEWDRLEAYFNSVTRCSLFSDTRVLEIVQEEASAYFAGDMTLDQTVARIQSRANLYVNELK